MQAYSHAGLAVPHTCETQIASPQSFRLILIGSYRKLVFPDIQAALREQFGPKFMTPDRNLQDKKSWLADEWGAQNVKNIDAWRQSHASRPK